MSSLPIRLPRRASLATLFLALAACGQNVVDEEAARGPTVVPVVTATVGRQPLTDRIEAIGTTHASSSVEITARISNVIARIGFTEGSFVDEGQVLVELESSEARANLAVAEAVLAEIRTQYERTEELIRSRAVSQSQLDQQAAQVNAAEARVAAARAVLADHTLRAPFAGRTGLRHVSIGSLVTPGTVITTLDNVREMNLDFAVPESYLSVLSAELPVTAHSVAWPDETFTGTVGSIDARIDPVSRTVTVRAKVANEAGRLRPGMFMTVELEKNPREAVVVPELALVPEGDSKYVFVVLDDTAIRRDVTIGTRRPGTVEILSGLEPGEEIVVEGTQSLRHGAPVRRVAGPGDALAEK